MDKGRLHAKIENSEYGNIKEENKVYLEIMAIHVICPPSLIYKYYTNDNIGHIYTLSIIMVMPCISFCILFLLNIIVYLPVSLNIILSHHYNECE